MGGAPYWSTPHVFFMALEYGFPMQPAWSSSFDPSMDGVPYWSTSLAFFAAAHYGFLVRQVGPSFTLPPSQQLPPSTLWFGEWDPQSLVGCLSSTTSAPPMPVTDWVADSGTTNHTTPTSVTFSHPGLLRLPILPPSLLVMVLSCPSPQLATRCFLDHFTSTMSW
jgi:hypothetical protein